MAVVDLRQLLAGVITFSMLVMLMNMVRTDYCDLIGRDCGGYRVIETRSDTELLVLSKQHRSGSSDALKPCWTRPLHRKLDQEERDLGSSRGYIMFSLSGGHEHHLFQVSNAIVVARCLGAILVLPDVIEKGSGDRRKFGEIYDVSKFITTIEGIVKIAITQPLGVSTRQLTLVRVPSGVSEEYVASKVEPIYKRKGSLKIVTYLSTSPVTKGEGNDTTSLSCLAMFEALQLKAELQKTIHSMIETLRSSGQKSSRLYIAVDLKEEMEGCQERIVNGRKGCYTAHAIRQFLEKIRIEREATIYLTSNGWNDSLSSLMEIYPNLQTKETLIPDDKVVPYLSPGTSVYKRIIDYYICSQSDIYVPAKFDHFYVSVVGERIATGERIVLEPAKSDSEDGASYISPYMLRKSHYAYSCFC